MTIVGARNVSFNAAKKKWKWIDECYGSYDLHTDQGEAITSNGSWEVFSFDGLIHNAQITVDSLCGLIYNTHSGNFWWNKMRGGLTKYPKGWLLVTFREPLG